MDKNRIENKASHTAFMGAVHRFLATKDFRIDRKRLDTLAYVFMPTKAKFFLKFEFFRKIFLKKLHKKVPGSYEYLTARTFFFDEIFENEAKDKISQIIVLGAGYDTRAIRFQNNTKNTKIFELDAPTTQKEKIHFLKKNNIQIPGNLIFAPINFDKENIKDALLSYGYNPKLKSLFLWEGVTMYLEPSSVNETFGFIQNNSGSESILAFDYFYKSIIDGTNTDFGADILSNSAENLGEQFKFGIEKGEIKEFLKLMNFELLQNFNSEELENTYLKTSNGDLIGNMYGFAEFVIAKKKK